MTPRPLPAPVRRPPTSAIRAAGTDRCDVVDLALGEPSWTVPRRAVETPVRWGYGPHAGAPALRREIAAYEGVDADEVLVTAGAQAALFAVVQTFVGAGDSVLVPDPGFPAYRVLAELAGGRAVAYPLDAKNDLDAGSLMAVLERTPDARLVVLDHPANPTGGLATAEALRRVAEACDERGVVLLADEVYRELTSDDAALISLRSVTRSGLVVGSLSKAFAAPGLRVGWLVGDPRLLEPCRHLHAAMTTHAAAPSQAAALALLRERDEALRTTRRELARRWDALEAAVDGAWHQETGHQETWHQETYSLRRTGLYHWFRVESFDDDTEFCRQARRAGVALVPGSAFGERGRGFVRMSLGAPPDAIAEGVRRLSGLVSGLLSAGTRNAA